MATATRVKDIAPYGVGRLTARWWVMAVISAILVGFGVFAYSRQLLSGLAVTGMRDIGTGGGAAWGLYIAFDVYFVGVSFSGITVAALIRLMNLERLKPIARMAELLTIVALVLAAFSVLPDLGRPARGIVNLFMFARPQSPFFGTFSLVLSGYLFASVVYLYLDGRKDAALCAQRPGKLQGFYRLWAAGYMDTKEERERHSRTSWWLALFILPLLVVAHSTLGFIFGIQGGRPGWFSAVQAPGFVVMAGLSGVGLLIVVVAWARKALKLQERIDAGVFRWLGNLLMVLTAAYLYLMAAEFLTTNYAAAAIETRVSDSLVRGQYAWLFWSSVALLVAPFFMLLGQFIARRHSLLLIVLSGVMVNLAAIGMRVLIVLPSQTNGTLLPYVQGSYSPTWVEYGVILGLLGLGTLLYITFIKLFPIVEIKNAPGGE